MSLGNAIEWFVSMAFVCGVTALCLWAFQLMGLSFESSAIAYLLTWVVLWDRREIAKNMREIEKSRKAEDTAQ